MLIDVVTADQAVSRIISWCDRDERHIVVTPNVDHAVSLRTDTKLRAVYEKAGLVVADGMPLVWASRLGGPRLPQRVTGADLIEPLCRALGRQRRSVFLLGTSLPSLTTSAGYLARTCPGLVVAGVYAPPYATSFDEAENSAMVDMINRVSPDVVLVALGMPKQEFWAGRNVDQLNTHAVLCIGASLDYLAGTSRRAPLAWQKVGLEWLWRVAMEPARLGPRYLRNLLQLPRLVFDQIQYVRRRKH